MMYTIQGKHILTVEYRAGVFRFYINNQVEAESYQEALKTVSYTHLTLPTKA